jgi:hypothetical protein
MLLIQPDNEDDIPLMMEAVRTSKTLVYFYETKLRYTPEGCNCHTCRLENLKSQPDNVLATTTCEVITIRNYRHYFTTAVDTLLCILFQVLTLKSVSRSLLFARDKFA